MAQKKKTDRIIFDETIVQKSMEDVLHDSMMPYSEYVILERALPRVEDGLKPVQRRILYTMHELGITHDKPHRKCARIVGDCLGKYHPHGDTSVYDALTRMAQPFAMGVPLVDGHGNFGSIDGDSPAAMRYTEARMTEYASLLLKDIDKDTVGFHLNFDDTQREPDVLPGRFPNLLVNGASGIAVGLATNIPPHNFGEVIDGVIAQIEDPDISLDDLMKHIPAPDFPTGGVLSQDEAVREAFETGRGKLKLRAKVSIESGPSGRHLIVIHEVPYQVNKAAMLEKILKLSEEKKTQLSGIYDIRDESDRTGMRAVIELKRDADPERVLNVLYKYSDLQISFGVNMVAIADGKPVQMGLKSMISYYIEHQKNVVTRRTRYELNQAESRAHILEGLMIAVDNLDEVIALIRASKTPKEARGKLTERFSLTELQAQAILDMRLQRLTGLEVMSLRKEYAELEKLIKKLKGILSSKAKLMATIKSELQEIRNKYDIPRRTELAPGFEQVEIPVEEPVADETIVMVTEAGFVRRMAPRLYEKNQDQGAVNLWTIRSMTDRRLLFFTDRGNCYAVGVSQISECRPKERGVALGGLLAGLETDENLVSLIEPGDWTGEMIFLSSNGLVKRSAMSDYNVRKQKFAALNLKEGTRLTAVCPVEGHKQAIILTEQGMSIHFNMKDVPVVGRTAAGVKGIALAEGDEALYLFPNDREGELILASDTGYLKRCLIIDFERQARGGKGVRAYPFTKSGVNGSRVAAALMVKEAYDFKLRQKSGISVVLNTEDIPIETKSGKGTPFSVVVMDDCIDAMIRVGSGDN